MNRGNRKRKSNRPTDQRRQDLAAFASSSGLRVGQRVKLHIDRLAVGGRGVARHEGFVVFVRDCLSGEDVEAEITLVKKTFAEADLVVVVTPAPARVIPPCPVATVCGGCNWQHIAYSEQLKWKRELVREALKKFSGFDPSVIDTRTQEVVPSPTEFRYRNRIQLHYAGSKIGFFKRGSHEIVNIDDCPITEERLANQIPLLRRELEKNDPGRLEIYLSQDGQVSRRGGAPELHDDPSKGASFSQVNTAQNVNLVRYVVSLFSQLIADASISDPTRPEPFLYDLYAGSGNFTFPLQTALRSAQITAVELSPSSVQMAKKAAARTYQNSTESRIPQFIQASVDDFTHKEVLPKDAFVLLDPPRTGCGPGVMEKLAEQNPLALVYVSCHPVTLARDLKALAIRGFELKSVLPFDMFPQTDHVETVALLVRKPT